MFLPQMRRLGTLQIAFLSVCAFFQEPGFSRFSKSGAEAVFPRGPAVSASKVRVAPTQTRESGAQTAPSQPPKPARFCQEDGAASVRVASAAPTRQRFGCRPRIRIGTPVAERPSSVGTPASCTPAVPSSRGAVYRRSAAGEYPRSPDYPRSGEPFSSSRVLEKKGFSRSSKENSNLRRSSRELCAVFSHSRIPEKFSKLREKPGSPVFKDTIPARKGVSPFKDIANSPRDVFSYGSCSPRPMVQKGSSPRRVALVPDGSDRLTQSFTQSLSDCESVEDDGLPAEDFGVVAGNVVCGESSAPQCPPGIRLGPGACLESPGFFSSPKKKTSLSRRSSIVSTTRSPNLVSRGRDTSGSVPTARHPTARSAVRAVRVHDGEKSARKSRGTDAAAVFMKAQEQKYGPLKIAVVRWAVSNNAVSALERELETVSVEDWRRWTIFVEDAGVETGILEAAERASHRDGARKTPLGEEETESQSHGGAVSHSFSGKNRGGGGSRQKHGRRGTSRGSFRRRRNIA